MWSRCSIRSQPCPQSRPSARNFWNVSEGGLLNRWEDHRDAGRAQDELEAEGAGIWASSFLLRRLPLLSPDGVMEALGPWAFESASADGATAESCLAFERGFGSSIAGLGLKVRLAMAWREQGRRDDLGAAEAVRALWPHTSLHSAPWLQRRQPWCPRFDRLRLESEQKRMEALANLAPQLGHSIHQHTSFQVRGNASLGLVFACRALYASDPEAAETALPCRMLGPFLSDLPGNEKHESWRARGDAARWGSHVLLRELVAVLQGALAGEGSTAEGPGEAARPRLRVWCVDSVLLSALLAALQILDPSAEPPPSSLAPAASRLVVAVTSRGALCAEYNGRPLVVAASAKDWLRSVNQTLATAGEGGEALCNEPPATPPTPERRASAGRGAAGSDIRRR
mmetsp:Transcript_106312/g.343516  ORF Transcript_106312/g.343516 Transcript_106312/m.343516 type:complete len:398 (-) Transcript_106312:57-1250(-)